MKPMRGTMSYQCKRAARTALAAMTLLTSVAPILQSARARSDAPGEATGRANPEASHVELQRQVNELRSELLAERERRIALPLVRQNLGKRSALGLFAESTVAGNTPLFVDRMLCIRYMFHLLLYYELSSSM